MLEANTNQGLVQNAVPRSHGLRLCVMYRKAPGMAAAELSYKTKPVVLSLPVASQPFHPVPMPEETAVPGPGPSSAWPP